MRAKIITTLCRLRTDWLKVNVGNLLGVIASAAGSVVIGLWGEPSFAQSVAEAERVQAVVASAAFKAARDVEH